MNQPIFQVKIWFQNRRSKQKKQGRPGSVNGEPMGSDDEPDTEEGGSSIGEGQLSIDRISITVLFHSGSDTPCGTEASSMPGGLTVPTPSGITPSSVTPNGMSNDPNGGSEVGGTPTVWPGSLPSLTTQGTIKSVIDHNEYRITSDLGAAMSSQLMNLNPSKDYYSLDTSSIPFEVRREGRRNRIDL